MSFGPTSSLFVVLVVTIGTASLGACSGQGEGQLCNPSVGPMGNDDCQSGLVCTPQPAPYMLGRCCPQDPSTAKTDVCAVHGGGLDASPVPPEASTEASTVEASADSPVETSSDAGIGADTSDAAKGSDADVGTGAEPADVATGGDASDATPE